MGHDYCKQRNVLSEWTPGLSGIKSLLGMPISHLGALVWVPSALLPIQPPSAPRRAPSHSPCHPQWETWIQFWAGGRYLVQWRRAVDTFLNRIIFNTVMGTKQQCIYICFWIRGNAAGCRIKWVHLSQAGDRPVAWEPGGCTAGFQRETVSVPPTGYSLEAPQGLCNTWRQLSETNHKITFLINTNQAT